MSAEDANEVRVSEWGFVRLEGLGTVVSPGQSSGRRRFHCIFFAGTYNVVFW